MRLESHHSLRDWSPNPNNIANDTQTNRVLLSDHFCYFGAGAHEIPVGVRTQGIEDIVAGRGYKVNFEADLVAQFVEWVEQLGEMGAIGMPREWLRRGGLRAGI